MTDIEQLNVRETIVHIDQMLADRARKQQEMRLAPWQLAFAGMTAGAAIFAAGAALGAITIRLLVG
jgi:hypothetical protein